MPALARTLRRWWPGGVLLVAVLWLHRGVLAGERYFFRDIHRLSAPAKFFQAQLLRHGVLPQWWPWDGGGSPMLAQPLFCTFHPSTLLYLVLPFWKAFAAQDILATVVELAGMYLLARALKQSRASALMASVLFVANGYVFSRLEATFMNLACAAMPWYVWSLLQADRRGRGWLVAPTIAMGLLVLAADPQTAILTSVAGFTILLARRPSLRNALLAGLSPLFGAALAAIQLVPSLMLAHETARGGALTERNRWPLDLAHVISLAIPLNLPSYATSLIVGLAGLVLIGASLSALRRRRTVVVLWVLVALGLWLALGDEYGLNAAARVVVPVWAKLRYPIKSVLLALFAASLLAGEGLMQLSNGKRRNVAVLSGALVGVLFLTLAVGAQGMQVGVTPALLLVSAAPMPFVLWAAWKRLPTVSALLACAQVLWFGGHVMPTVPASFYEEPQLAHELTKLGVGLKGPSFDRIESAGNDADHPFLTSATGGGANTSYGAFFKLPTLTYYSPAASLRLETVFNRKLDLPTLSRLFGIYGVKYMLLSADLSEGGAIQAMAGEPPLLVDAAFGHRLFALKHSLPRAYLVHRARPVPDTAAARDELFQGHFKPGREVLLEGASDRPDWSDRPDQLAVPATIEQRTNSSVSIQADAPWPGFLVLNEAYFTGWTATLDGKPAPVYVANGFVRAVEVPAGKHTVEFHYRTPGLAFGACLSLIAWLLAALAWLYLRQSTSIGGLRSIASSAPESA